MLVSSLIASFAVALLSPSVVAAPLAIEHSGTLLAKRSAPVSVMAGVVATGNDFQSMSSTLVVPFMSVPPGGDPTQLYAAQVFIALADSAWLYPLTVGIECLAGSQTRCEAIYEYEPAVPPTVLSGFTVNAGDSIELVLAATSPETAIIYVNNLNTLQTSETVVSRPYPGAIFSDAVWMVENAESGFINFGIAEFTGAQAETANDETVTPNQAQLTYEIMQGGTTLSRVATSSSSVTISYV